MADLPEVAKFIQVEEIDERSPGGESALQKIGSSLNHIQNTLQTLAVGSIEPSMLTEAQYQAIRGTGFILADGRSVVGSTYETITGQANIPDLRGMMIRMKDHGAGVNPDGDLALGTYQDAENAAHTHVTVYSNAVPTGLTMWWPYTGPGPKLTEGGTERTNTLGDSDPIVAVTADITPVGTDSGVPKNVTMNFFIRIN